MKKLLVLILVLMMAVPLLAADTAMDSFTADASPDDEGQIIGYDTGVATRWPVSAFQLRDATLTALAGLTFADKSIIQLTGADAAAVLTCASANMLIGVNAANDALECKSTINVLLDNSAAQFADSVAPTKLVKIDPVGNTAGATTTLAFGNSAHATITFPSAAGTLQTVKDEKLASFAWDGGGSAVATASSKRCTIFPSAATVVGVYAIADASTTTHIHVYQDAFAAGARSTTVTSAVDIGATLGAKDTTLTGWDKSITAGDEICMSVEANDNAKWLTVIVYGTR